jgi:hypothetical protein
LASHVFHGRLAVVQALKIDFRPLFCYCSILLFDIVSLPEKNRLPVCTLRARSPVFFFKGVWTLWTYLSQSIEKQRSTPVEKILIADFVLHNRKTE